MATRRVLTPRRALVGGFGLVAGFLVMASVAHACVLFVGDLVLTSLDAPNTGSRTVARDGGPITGSGQHAYCPTREPVLTADVAPGKQLRADWDPGTLCATTPPDGTYDVRTRPVPTYTGADGVLWEMTPETGCFRPGNSYHDIGDMSVSGGVGTGSYTIPASYSPDSPTTAHNFCIGGRKEGGAQGILAPYQVTI